MASLSSIEKLANHLMANNKAGVNLLAQGWRFELGGSNTAVGTCWYETKVINVSKFFAASLDRRNVADVLLHEIAHAIVGGEHEHGPSWKRVAVILGTKPKSTTQVANPASLKAKYTIMFGDEVVGIAHRVLKHMSTRYVTGRKAETEGKLILRKNW